MAERNGETVHTLADSFGVWYARITFPDGGYGPDHLKANADRIRAKARRAIRRQILAREAGPIRPVRVEVVKNDVDHMNVMHSITYKERTDA